MIQIRSTSAPRSTSQQRLQRAIGATAVAIGAALLALSGAASASADPTAPPPVTILTSSPFVGQGDFFITPTGDATTYANGPEILDQPGQRCLVPRRSRRARRQPTSAAELRRPARADLVAGNRASAASRSGTDYIYNDHFQQIATVNAGNGLSADGHEFLITPWNTALILSYTTATADLTSIGGPADQTVIDGVVQEIDIATGKVLFQWNSEDHVPVQPERAAAARLGEHAVGLVPHQRRQARHRRQPADRRPRHVDDL